MAGNSQDEPAHAGGYRNIAFERREGVLLVRLHTDGGPLKWGAAAGAVHEQLGDAFRSIGRDPANRVVILTGTGAEFCTQRNAAEYAGVGFEQWPRLMREGRDMLLGLLEIDVPVIAAVNGPALIHPELMVLADIVVAARTASFSDSHMRGAMVPGDGCHVVWNRLLGPSRGHYFLLMEEVLTAARAHELGVVHELVDPEHLLSRAWEIARRLAEKPLDVLRYSRMLFAQPWREAMTRELSLGLAYEGLATR